jgi:hypothetical protein
MNKLMVYIFIAVVTAVQQIFLPVTFGTPYTFNFEYP